MSRNEEPTKRWQFSLVSLLKVMACVAMILSLVRFSLPILDEFAFDGIVLIAIAVPVVVGTAAGASERLRGAAVVTAISIGVTATILVGIIIGLMIPTV
jgi:hypothetical protein